MGMMFAIGPAELIVVAVLLLGGFIGAALLVWILLRRPKD